MASRLSVVALLAVLSSACSATRVVHLDTRQGAVLAYSPASWDKSVEVDAAAFTKALTQLVLESPLALHPTQQGELVRAAFWNSSESPRWQDMARRASVVCAQPASRRKTASRCSMTSWV